MFSLAEGWTTDIHHVHIQKLLKAVPGGSGDRCWKEAEKFLLAFVAILLRSARNWQIWRWMAAKSWQGSCDGESWQKLVQCMQLRWGKSTCSDMICLDVGQSWVTRCHKSMLRTSESRASSPAKSMLGSEGSNYRTSIVSRHLPRSHSMVANCDIQPEVHQAPESFQAAQKCWMMLNVFIWFWLMLWYLMSL